MAAQASESLRQWTRVWLWGRSGQGEGDRPPPLWNRGRSSRQMLGLWPGVEDLHMPQVLRRWGGPRGHRLSRGEPRMCSQGHLSSQFCSLSCPQPHRGAISLHQREGTKGEVIYYSIPLCLFPEKLIMVHCCIRYFQKDYIFLLWPIKKLNPSVFLNTLQ